MYMKLATEVLFSSTAGLDFTEAHFGSPQSPQELSDADLYGMQSPVVSTLAVTGGQELLAGAGSIFLTGVMNCSLRAGALIGEALLFLWKRLDVKSFISVLTFLMIAYCLYTVSWIRRDMQLTYERLEMIRTLIQQRHD
eukprot:GHVN01055283.1.p1 GENE.GHVN01055283.1~~GHVN01055283.1.p1  ORF type:complete len:139 (-),score=3.67 GHVN01055283.1:358-774(-)